MNIDITNNYDKTYESAKHLKDISEKKNQNVKKNKFSWTEFISQLQWPQIGLILLVVFILYFVDALIFFNAIQGFAAPSVIPGLPSQQLQIPTHGKKKKK